MKLLTTLPFLLLSLLLGAQETSDAEYIKANYTKREVMVPMRDGVRLFTSIYTPKDRSRKYPVLMRRTPYSCSPYGTDAYVRSFQNMHLARSGYIFVFQDVRGKYMSEGEYMDVRPFNPDKKSNQDTDEASDTYDTAEWLIRYASGNNGRIGVYGISYPGFYATMAILAGHPAIKAVSPQAPVTDWFIGDDFHHNGAFMLMDGFRFYSGFGKPRPEPTTRGARGFQDWNTPDNYDFFLQAGALPDFNKKYLKGEIPFWNQLMEHPDMDSWWQARNPRPHLKNIKPAVLTVGGLFDAEDCFGAWNVYKAIEGQNPPTTSNRLVMGPWSHGGWARNNGDRLGNVTFGQSTSPFYQTSIEFPFFEYYLKGEGKMDLPDAYIFETGSNRWTTYDTWPPSMAKNAHYYLQEGGLLSPELSGGTGTSPNSFDRYISDPAKPVPYTEDVHLRRTREYMTDDQRFAARRPDVLVYQTPVLEKALTLTGPVIADLWVSLDDRGKAADGQLLDADFVVKLIDVFPDTMSGEENGVPLGGFQMLVRGEIFRGRYRNSFEKPEGFQPRTKTRVRFELPDVAHAFQPGHKLMIQVQSSWFPLADRNPQQFVNIYEAADTDFIPLEITLYHDNEHVSKVELPVLDSGQ
ncbi:MAG: CocE/NonD family hydrolase [Bacteroidetes bacterium]|nr:MAG: CocE/NonD family hydrolase [Bacteroidota bacterium]